MSYVAAPTTGYKVLRGLVADNGASASVGTANLAALNSQLSALSTAGGGIALLPSATSYYGISGDLSIPSNVQLQGVSPWKIKNPGNSVPTAGNFTGSTIGPAASGSFTNGVVSLDGVGATLQNISIYGTGSSDSSNVDGKRAIYVNSTARIRNVLGYGGSIATIDTTSSGNAAIDTNIIDSVFINAVNNAGISKSSVSVTSGSGVCTGLASTSNLAAGMAVGTGDGTFPVDTYILSVDSSTQITVSQNSTATATVTLKINDKLVGIPGFSLTSGSANVTMPSGYTTAVLSVGMSIFGGVQGLPGTAMISSITNSSTFVMTANATATVSSKTLVFNSALTMRIIGASDCLVSSTRTLSGMAHFAGANVQAVGCHFSTISVTTLPNFVVLQTNGQGCFYTGCVFDTGNFSWGTFRRDIGSALHTGCRYINGLTATPASTTPAIVENGISDGKGTTISGAQVPLVGSDGFSSFIKFNSGTTPGSTSITGMWADTNALQSGTVTAGGTIGLASGVMIGGTLQARIPSGGYVLQLENGVNLNATDGQTYYAGAWANAGFTTVAGNRKVYIPKAGTITAVQLYFFNNGTLGSSETSTMSIRLNDTTDSTISSAITNDAISTTFSNSSMSVTVAAGDFIELKWVAPTWNTNPTNVRYTATVYIEQT